MREITLIASTNATTSTMQRYGGNLIYSCRDEQGIIEVVDDYNIRSLHFGTPPKQSSLILDDPDKLELPYVKAMTAGLMFRDHPAKVLMLGLGGGSLTRYFCTHFPSCHIVVVELRAKVAEIAKRYFMLPDDPRLKLHIGDACDFVSARAESGCDPFDIILVDAYDHIGMDQNINAEEFFENCKTLLTPDGVLVINLWGTHRVSLHQSIRLLKETFGSKTFQMPVPHRGNIIGIALHGDAEISVMSKLREKAQELESRLGLDMTRYLSRMKPL
jgi:spermidine synthase